MKGERLEGRVRDLAHDGAAVVETAQGIVMASGGLPGETVRLAVDPRGRGRVRRGRLLAVLEASPDRVVAPCALADACGGCPWMVLSRPAQVARKAARVREATGVAVSLAAEGDGLHYRRRARLHFEVARGAARLGYRPARSAGVLDVEACAVLVPPLAGALSAARAELLPLLAGAGEVLLGVGRDGLPVLSVRTGTPQPPALYGALERLVAERVLAGATLEVGEGAAPARWGEPREFTPTLGDTLEGPFPGFSQANDGVNLALVAAVVEVASAEGEDVLEYYAGHGNLTLPLARAARSVRAVEVNASGADALRANAAKARATNISVVTADAADVVPRDERIVVLDPPRTGAREVLDRLIESAATRVVYVSCDTPTLARDLGVLAAGGFAVRSARAFDMFPHTAHVESVVLAERERGR